MKTKSLLFLGVIILIVSCWFYVNKKSTPKDVTPTAIKLKSHSESFNNNIQKVVDAYLNIKDAFVDGDTSLVKSTTQIFIKTLDSIDTLELKKDTASVYETVLITIQDIKSNASSILLQNDITEMRKDFSSMTDVMFPSFFYTINYEGPTLYLANCPMAFYDSIPANWISKNEEIMNPYMGKNHPIYKSGMLHCGEVKDSIKAK
jgi:hypothetical protein